MVRPPAELSDRAKNKLHDGKIYLEVKWDKYPSSENTFELKQTFLDSDPRSHINYCYRRFLHGPDFEEKKNANQKKNQYVYDIHGRNHVGKIKFITEYNSIETATINQYEYNSIKNTGE